MATEFKLFGQLPPEIRELIWTDAYDLPTPGIHFVLHSEFREHDFTLRLNLGAPTFRWIAVNPVQMRSRYEVTANIAASSYEAEDVLKRLCKRPGCAIDRVPLKTRFYSRRSGGWDSNFSVHDVLLDSGRDLLCLRLPSGHGQGHLFMQDLQDHVCNSLQRHVAVEVGPWLLDRKGSLRDHRSNKYFFMMACPRHVETIYLVDPTLNVRADVLGHCDDGRRRARFDGNGATFVEVHSGDPILFAWAISDQHRVEDVLELAHTVKHWVINAREHAGQEIGVLEVKVLAPVLAPVYYR